MLVSEQRGNRQQEKEKKPAHTLTTPLWKKPVNHVSARYCMIFKQNYQENQMTSCTSNCNPEESKYEVLGTKVVGHYCSNVDWALRCANK